MPQDRSYEDDDDMQYYSSTDDEDTYMRGPTTSQISQPVTSQPSSPPSEAVRPLSPVPQSSRQDERAVPGKEKDKGKGKASNDDVREVAKPKCLFIRRFHPTDEINVRMSSLRINK